jgi:hypothetical protein
MLYPALPNSHDNTLEKKRPIITKHIYVTICHPVLRHEMNFGGTLQENDASYKVGNMVTLISEIIENSN